MKISGLMGSNCTMHSAWYEHEVVKCFQQWTFPSSSQADKSSSSISSSAGLVATV